MISIVMKDCVCDSGHEWCCNNKRKARSRGAIGNYIMVGDDEKCADGSTPGIWGCTDTGASTDKGLLEQFFSAFKPPAPPKPSTAAQAATGVAQAIVGGMQGAAAAKTAAAQAAIYQQQAAARNKQMKMLAVLGVVGIGAIMLLNRGD